MIQRAGPAHEAVQDGKVMMNAEALKALRKQHGLSQDALAQLCLRHRLCVSIASIKRAETGKAVLYRTASHLARVYNANLDELIGASSPNATEDAAADDAVEPRSVLALTVLSTAPLADAQLARIAAAVEQYGGRHVPPAQALFGLPSAYGSDAVRCLQCAAAIARLLDGQQASVLIDARTLPYGVDQPSVAQRSWLLNQAAVASTAGATGIPAVYIDRDLGAQIGARFELASVAGAAELLRVVREHCDAHPAAAHYPLIGRQLEIQQFKLLLESTLDYQRGHILYLRGVAGIGKSRLTQEFLDIAQQSRFACHQAVVLDFGMQDDVPPLGQLVRALLGLASGVLPQESDLCAQMNRIRLPSEWAMHYRGLLGMPQTAAAAALYGAIDHQTRELRQVEAIRELIVRRAVECPLMLVLEDIHWAAPELIATLAGVFREVQEIPVIWLLSSRFEGDPFERMLRPYLNGEPVTMLDLAVLRAPEAQQMAQEMARNATGADPEFHARCIARAQGNPLFLTQLLLADPSRGRELPSSLQNLIQAKLDQLPAVQRRGLRVAAAIGQYFSLAMLRDVLHQSDHDMGDSVAQFIVRPTSGDGYVFVHDLVMHGIYDAVPPSQREEMHLAIARSYGAAAADPHAQHLHKARHADAPAAMLEVISQRIAAFRYHQALELIAVCASIDYAPRDDYRLQLLAGRCHAKIGQTPQARTAFEAALEIAQGHGQRVAAVIGLATALNVLEDLAGEERLLDAAIADAHAHGEEEGLAELYYLKGNIYFPAANYLMSRQLHELSQRYARSKDTEARALSGIGDSYYAQGRIVTAHGVFAQCVALCEQHGMPDIEASNRFMLGTTRIYLNETEGALADALAAAETGLRVGNRRAEIVSRLTAGWTLLSLGRVADARQQVEQGLDVARLIGAARFEPFLNESMVRVLLLEGDAAGAHALALQAWEQVQRHKIFKFIGPWVLSTLALAEPDAAARERALAEGQALLAQGCVAHNTIRFHVSAMESRLIHGDLAAARALADAFEAGVKAEPYPWASHHIAMVRASADWLAAPHAAHQSTLRDLMRAGRDAGLEWVMPLWRQRLATALPLD